MNGNNNGIIQKIFNQFRVERLGRSITHSETLTLENRLIEEIKNACEAWDEPEDIQTKLIGDNNE